MILIMPTFSYTLLKHTSDGSGAWDTSTESIERCYLYKDSITTSCGGVDGDVVVCVVHGDHCRRVIHSNIMSQQIMCDTGAMRNHSLYNKIGSFIQL